MTTFTSLSRAFRHCTRNWHICCEITGEVYNEALGSVPPIFGQAANGRDGVFWMGEPWTHDQKGREVALECWYVTLATDERRYFCAISPVVKPPAKQASTVAQINLDGGIIEDVFNLPPGWTYEVHDYDVEDLDVTTYRNWYKCACAEQWHNDRESMGDDICPKCGAVCLPSQSVVTNEGIHEIETDDDGREFVRLGGA